MALILNSTGETMHLLSEATLLKMETSCTRLRKEIEDAPTFWQACQYPQVLLRTSQTCALKSYLRAAVLSTTALISVVCLIQCFVPAVSLLLVPHLWSMIFDPKNHAHVISGLSQEGFYYLPFAPLIWLLASLAINWPRYFFWNRRAKRLQQEGYIEVQPVTAAIVADDPNVWPPAPRL